MIFTEAQTEQFRRRLPPSTALRTALLLRSLT